MRLTWWCELHSSGGIPGTYFCEMAGLPSFVDAMVTEGRDPCDSKYHRMAEVLVVNPQNPEQVAEALVFLNSLTSVTE